MRRPVAFFVLLLFAGSGVSAAADCSRTSTGLVPLTELGAGLYKGMQGGLYPGGINTRPAAHEAAGLRLAALVVPRDTFGTPSAGGKIVLLSIGMSNTTQEFQAFMPLANADPEKNSRVVVVDGAQGGKAANVIVNPNDSYWPYVDQQIANAGVTAAQVQAVWLKQADISPTKPFPDDAKQLQGESKTIIQILHTKFPNLVLVYLSSRTYGGYATSTLNPEPYAYQGAFAFKWLIEQQINGDPDLSYDAGKAPWLAWGPYLWADGTRLRPDGLSYACDDFVSSDGTHPSASGRTKVAVLLLNFLKTDPTSRPWFVAPPASTPPTPRPLALVSSASYGATIAPRALVSVFGSDLARGTATAGPLPLPLTLNGVTVELNGVACPLLYVSSTQINVVLPSDAAGGVLRVRREGVVSDALPVVLAALSPGIFMLPPADVAAAQHAADYSLVSDAAPAAPGETIVLYVTGLGAIDLTAWQAAAPPTAAVPPTVRIGGRDATVTWAGPNPVYPGLDQINVVVPSGILAGKATVEVSSGSVLSAPATLSIR
jgi:uncharacterized protein (TIGR03437 family)